MRHYEHLRDMDDIALLLVLSYFLLYYKYMIVTLEYVHIKNRIKLLSFVDLIYRNDEQFYWTVEISKLVLYPRSRARSILRYVILYILIENRPVIIKYHVRCWRTNNKRNNQMWFTLHSLKIHSAWLIIPQQNTEQLPGRNVRKQEEFFLKRILPYFPKLNVTLSPISTKGAQCFTSG